MAATSPTADEIQNQMSQVRYDMGDDVQGLVDNARILTDWTYYVRTYPWLCVGAAAAAGFLVVPQKVQMIQPDPKAMVELAKAHQIQVKADVQPKPAGLANRLLGMLAGMALQSGVALASGQLQQFLDRSMHRPKADSGNGKWSSP